MASPNRLVAEPRRRGGQAPLEGQSTSNDRAAMHVETSTQWLENKLRVCPSGPDFCAWGHLSGLKKIACGGFATVYRASDPLLQREVALKLYGQGKYLVENWFELGLHEARLLARVRHPNVVTVYGVDHHNGRLGIWMEYVHGRTLEALLRDLGPLAAREAALAAFDICSAVGAVHGLGLLHCDVTLRNVMREEGGRIVLMDFGLSKDLAAEGDSRICGTPLYMAPELLSGQTCSVQSDIYSIGTVLYRLVTAKFPVQGRTFNEVRAMHERGETILLRDRRPDLPEAFHRIVDHSLAVDAGGRFSTCGHMAQALGEFLDDR